MESGTFYVQRRNVNYTPGPRVQNQGHAGGKSRKYTGRSICMVSLGLICVLLLIFIIWLNITITAEREEHKNTVQEFNHTFSSLQTNYTDLRTEKDQLQKKNQESETRVKDLTAEKQQLQQRFDSLNQNKLECESRVKDLSAEKQQLQQKKLELERSVASLRNRLQANASVQDSFFISSEAKPWSESRQFCRDHGGDLVIIETEEKQRFISSLVKERMWIGLSDIQQEGKMTWVDNSPLTNGFWLKGEPNNQDGNEDCIELMPANPILNNWNDLPCSNRQKGICEK